MYMSKKHHHSLILFAFPCLLMPLFHAPDFSFGKSSLYHQPPIIPSLYLENQHLDRTDSSYHSVFCVSTEPKVKGRNEQKPSRQTHWISFKHCPPAGFSMQFLMDWLMPELCIFLAIPPSFKGLFCR